MPSDQLKFVVLSIPALSLLTVSQAAIGCGLGILVADKVGQNRRNAAAIGMLSLAAAATIPAVVGLVADMISGPRSRLGVRRRLRSIREDSGLHAEEEVF
ncbi:MAG: hypothetical protein JOY96_02510 [Verrucomicrobia bacterium]|nr:hypothetical protein [Verrucomicrobiota bacterium]MBV9672510.1 hypothetical protein [Verrucomicrobiota bacterium]